MEGTTMSMYLALFIVLGFFAIGDILGVATKAKLSSVFVALMLFMICFMTGLIPGDIIDQAKPASAKWPALLLCLIWALRSTWMR